MPESFKLHHGLHDSLDPKAISIVQANDFPVVTSASASGVDSPQISAASTDFGPLRLLSMSAYPSKEFTLPEKVELLVNILQQIVPDLPSYLLNLLLVDLQREPLWMDIALPKGRTLHACQIAFEDMRKQYRQSNPRPQPLTSYANIAPAPTIGRSFSEHDPYAPTRRPPILQPRPVLRTTESPNPPVTNGDTSAITRTTLGPDLVSLDSQRKRGRPSKAEVAARAREYAEKGEVYVPKRRHKKPRTSLLPEGGDFKDEESSTPLLRTPTANIPEAGPESSSGKRRRRQTREGSPLENRSAETDIHKQRTEQDPESNITGSPSDRLLLSHRDRGSVGSSLSRPTHQGSEPLESSYLESESLT